MNDNLHKSVKNLAKSMSVLLVDDDELILDVYRPIFDELFLKVYTANDGAEAFEKWRDQTKRIDLIITDMMMPNLNGCELINNIRKHSSTQHVIILTSIDDLNHMRKVVNLGVDGIILKPYTQEKVLPVLNRVLEVIKTKKVMKRQIFQLKLLSQEKVALKITEKHHNEENLKIETPIIEHSEKTQSSLSSKYNIRKTVVGSNAIELDTIVNYENTNNIDRLINTIQDTESLMISLETSSTEEIIHGLHSSIEAIEQLIVLMNGVGSFNVAVEAAEHLILLIGGMNVNQLEDTGKKELFFDAYLAMFQDIEGWLNTVFINRQASNINYFDASFANTCLELETIFADEIEEDDSELEFF